MKTCTKCHKSQPLDQYGKHPLARDGLQTQCRTCRREYRRGYRAAHPDRCNAAALASYHRNKAPYQERSTKWKQKNAEYVAQYQAEYNAANQDRKNAYAARHRKEHPERQIEFNAIRRARERNAPVIEKIDRAALIERDSGICYLCGASPQGWYLTLDHVIPLVRGGTHTADNLRVACRSCNSKKATRLLS